MSMTGVVCEKHAKLKTIDPEFIEDYLRCPDCKTLWHKAVYGEEPDDGWYDPDRAG